MGLELSLKETVATLRSARAIALILCLGLGRWARFGLRDHPGTPHDGGTRFRFAVDQPGTDRAVLPDGRTKGARRYVIRRRFDAADHSRDGAVPAADGARVDQGGFH